MNAKKKSYVYFVRVPFIVVIVSLLTMGTFARRGWLDWRRITQKNDELSEKIAGVLSQKQALERQKEAFQNDKEEQKRVIRQNLGFIAKDETIVEFD